MGKLKDFGTFLGVLFEGFEEDFTGLLKDIEDRLGEGGDTEKLMK